MNASLTYGPQIQIHYMHLILQNNENYFQCVQSR